MSVTLVGGVMVDTKRCIQKSLLVLVMMTQVLVTLVFIVRNERGRDHRHHHHQGMHCLVIVFAGLIIIIVVSSTTLFLIRVIILHVLTCIWLTIYKCDCSIRVVKVGTRNSGDSSYYGSKFL